MTKQTQILKYQNSVDETQEAVIIETYPYNSKAPSRYYVVDKNHEFREGHWIDQNQVVPKSITWVPDDLCEGYMFLKGTNYSLIYFGRSALRPWYFSPYPSIPFSDSLFVCPFCFSYFDDAEAYEIHRQLCIQTTPPGQELWRSKQQDKTLSIFQVDGAIAKNYCQNLVLFTRLYLEHKDLTNETDIFYFFILCVFEDRCRPVGFFSKEKRDSENILSCILCFPHYQGRGFGHLLIDAAYGMNIQDMRQGGPEEPLSDYGKVSFVSYWTYKIFSIFGPQNSEIDFDVIRKKTGISIMHISLVFAHHGLLKKTPSGEFVIVRNEIFDKLHSKALEKSKRVLSYNPDDSIFVNDFPNEKRNQIKFDVK